ncbi:MAG: hypothetical protein QOI14_1543, partial [Actinomycetota bacterium]|nr:hypothetical protein [Actinomycetota bacterium]
RSDSGRITRISLGKLDRLWRGFRTARGCDNGGGRVRRGGIRTRCGRPRSNATTHAHGDDARGQGDCRDFPRRQLRPALATTHECVEGCKESDEPRHDEKAAEPASRCSDDEEKQCGCPNDPRHCGGLESFDFRRRVRVRHESPFRLHWVAAPSIPLINLLPHVPSWGTSCHEQSTTGLCQLACSRAAELAARHTGSRNLAGRQPSCGVTSALLSEALASKASKFARGLVGRSTLGLDGVGRCSASRIPGPDAANHYRALPPNCNPCPPIESRR